MLPLEATSLDAAYQLADKRLYSLKRDHKSFFSTSFSLYSWNQFSTASPSSPNNSFRQPYDPIIPMSHGIETRYHSEPLRFDKILYEDWHT